MRLQENWTTHTSLVGRYDTAFPENSMAVSLKIEHATTIQANNCTPGHLSYRNHDLPSHKYLYANVYRSLIHNS